MITRFDHAVLAVPDLAAATARFAELGFDVRAGGRHTGLGTHNAIVRFGADYLELISVYDEAEARQASRWPIIDVLDRGGGPLGMAFAADIDTLAATLRAAGIDAVGPFPMRRARPDGTDLSWRLLLPEGGVGDRSPWPFFIDWDVPDTERLRAESFGPHPNGATGVRGLSVGAADLDRATAFYTRLCNVTVLGDAWRAGRATRRLRVAGVTVELVAQPEEGLLDVTLAVTDLAATRAVLDNAGAGAVGSGGGIVVPDAAGTPLGFVPAQ